MNAISARRRVALYALGILLPMLMSVALPGCKDEDAGQDAGEQAAVEQVQKIVAAEQNELIGPDGKIKLRILLTTSPMKWVLTTA